jgi:hypothetical protein
MPVDLRAIAARGDPRRRQGAAQRGGWTASHEIRYSESQQRLPSGPSRTGARRGRKQLRNHATVEGMKARKRRRAGATETVGVSLDAETKRQLKALAEERHQGNVSALITEMTEAAVRQAAFERD